MYKYIRFFLKNICWLFIKFIIAFLPRNKNIIVTGLSTKNSNGIFRDYFMHNTKYLFLYLSKENKYDFKVVYLCDDSVLREKLQTINPDVYSRKSLKGVYYKLRAKYWLYDNEKKDLPCSFLSGGATCINFWHGTSWKKIGFDGNEGFQKRGKLQQNIQKTLTDKDDYLIANNDYEVDVYNSAFLVDKQNIPILCSPRLDVLYNGIEGANYFMEEDFAAIKGFKEQGKKIFIYMPTFRDTGKDISGWLKSDKLKQFLKDNNAVLVCKLHFADKNALSFEPSEELYKMNGQSDMYPILKYSDGLITDYSSIALDYLLLDKPIIYYPLDLEEYQAQCRGFYVSYDTFVAGDKVYIEEELITSMQKVITGEDNYKAKRKELCDKMFKYHDGKNCERIVQWISRME